jgi:hypothetical protein
MNCYFIGMMYGRSCTKFLNFRVDHTTNIATIGSLLFVIGQLKKGRFCIKFPHLVQLGKQTRPPWEILLSNWL